MNDSSDDELPPLQDMSILVNHLKQAKPEKIADLINDSVIEKNEPNKSLSSVKSKSIGLKKGFFGNTSSKKSFKSPNQDPTKINNIPTIAPNPFAKSNLQFDEVQKAMDVADWKTPEFYKAMTHRPEIMKGFNDPELMNAVGEFSRDPHAAMEKYKDREDVRQFMMSFSDLMGRQFQKLSEDQKKFNNETLVPSTENDLKPHSTKNLSGAKIEELDINGNTIHTTISDGAINIHPDPKVREALNCPKVRHVLDALRSGQPIEFHSVARSAPDVAMKLQILIQSGLLNTQTHA